MSLIGVHQILITWLSTVMCLLGKRGKLQFGGRERHITGMNILLSMSSVFAMCRNTTTDTLKPQLDVLTALSSSLSAGYGQILKAGSTKITCRILYWQFTSGTHAMAYRRLTLGSMWLLVYLSIPAPRMNYSGGDEYTDDSLCCRDFWSAKAWYMSVSSLGTKNIRSLLKNHCLFYLVFVLPFT